MIRWKWSVTLAGLALAGCGWIGGGPAEPDTLAKWASAQGVIVQDPAGLAQGGKDAGTVRKTVDGHGYEIVPPKDSALPPSRLYLVPLATLDPALDSDLRKRMFTGGLAKFAPEADGKPPRTIALSELDKFYVQLTVSPGNALCAKLTTPCAAADSVTLTGKLKASPLFGKGSRSIALSPVVVPENLIGKDVADDQTLCGFDPQRDRVPAHAAAGCTYLRRMTWAEPHGFTLTAAGELFPLSDAALRTYLRSFVDGALKAADGALGTIAEEH